MQTFVLFTLCIFINVRRSVCQFENTSVFTWDIVHPFPWQHGPDALISEHADVCPSLTSYDSEMETAFAHTREECLDKTCDCTFRCFRNLNCCPDAPDSYVVRTCRKVHIRKSEKINKYLAFLIEECPHPEHKYANKCDVAYPTVLAFSPNSGILYKNRYCALCYDENEVIEIPFIFGCERNSETYGLGIAEMLKQGMCTFNYDIPQNFSETTVYKKCFGEGILGLKLVDRCNMTGLWTEYNADIEWACKRLNQRYRYFKNHFCALCNPTYLPQVHMPSYIDTCPLGNEGNNSTVSYTQRCDKETPVPSYYPYKNPYCWRCNEDTFNFSNANKFEIIDPLPIIEKEIVAAIRYSLNFTFENSELEPLLVKLINDILKELNGSLEDVSYSTDIRPDSSLHFTKSDLYEIKRSLMTVCGHQNNILCYLEEGLYNISIRSDLAFPLEGGITRCSKCSCKDFCELEFEKGKRCCLDKGIQERDASVCQDSFIYPVLLKGAELVSDQNFTYTHMKMRNRVIHKCIRRRDNAELVGKCENQPSDMLQLIPVKVGEVAYKNIYCVLCNLKLYNTYNVSFYLRLACPNYFSSDILQNEKDVFNAAKALGCMVAFTLPHSDIDTCFPVDIERRSEPMVHECFDGEGWYEYPYPIDGCYGDSCYRRVGVASIKDSLCDIINLPQSYFFRTLDVVAVQQNGTSSDNRYMLCALRKTDSPSKMKIKYCSLPIPGYLMNTVMYRNLFSLTAEQFNIIALVQEGKAKCQANESLDVATNECQPLSCQGLRVLKQGKCVHYKETDEKLGYRISNVLISPTNVELFGNNVCLRDRKPGSITDIEELQDLICETLIDIINTAVKVGSSAYDIQCGVYAFDKNSVLESSTDKYVATGWNLQEMGPNGEWCDCKFCFSSDLDFYIEVDIYFISMFNKSQIEDNLIAITEAETFSVYKSGIEYTFKQGPFFIADFLKLFKCKTLRKKLHSDKSDTHYADLVKKTISCVGVSLDVTEAVYKGASAILTLKGHSSEVVVPLNALRASRLGHIYSINFGKVYTYALCRDDYETLMTKVAESKAPEKIFALKEDGALDWAYYYFSLCCALLSLTALFIAMVTYILFPSLRTTPGKNNLTLCVCLFFAQFCMEVQSLHTIFLAGSVQCRLIAIAIHYFWMTTFCSMFTCCYHMFRIFSSFTKALESDKGLYKKYLLVVMVTPALIVSLVIAFNLGFSKGQAIGYGTLFCLFDNSYSVIFGFLTPAACIFALNIVFFSVTFYKIHGSPTLQSNRQSRRDLLMYVKLCTVTGITWPMLIVDAMFDFSWFSFVATFFNALQGMFVFMAFVCNRRVFDMYRQFFGCLKTVDSSTTKSTSSMRLGTSMDTTAKEKTY